MHMKHPSPTQLQADAQAADKLLQAYAYQKAARRTAEQELNALQNLLEALAARNPEWFAHQQTYTLPHGKLCYVQRSTALLAAQYSPQAVYAAFPQALKLQPAISQLKVLLEDPATRLALEQLGLGICTETQFEVKI
jgi:hypothetical protein